MFVHKYNQVLFWSCFQQAEICIWASLRCFPCSCKQLRYSDFTFSASASAHYFLFINPRLILFCHKATLELCPSVVLFRLLGCTVRLTAAQIWVSFFFFLFLFLFPLLLLVCIAWLLVPRSTTLLVGKCGVCVLPQGPDSGELWQLSSAASLLCCAVLYEKQAVLWFVVGLGYPQEHY